LPESRKREILYALMSEIRGREALRGAGGLRRTEQRSIFTIFKNMPIAVITIIVALLGGGTSFAAQGALPGNALYPIKIYVNEGVAGAFQLSENAKAAWEVHLASERLDEAAQLSAKGELKGKNEEQVREAFTKHAEKAEDRAEKLREKGNLTAAASVVSDLESSLRAHEGVLQLFTDASGTVRVITMKLNGTIKIRAEIEHEIEATSTPNVKPAAEGKIKAAENVIASVKSFLAAHATSTNSASTATSTVTTSTIAEANAKIQVAENLVAQAKAEVTAGHYANAFNLAQHALRTAQEARISLHLRFELKIEKGDDDDEHDNASSTKRGERERNAMSTERREDDDDRDTIKIRGDIRATTTLKSELKLETKTEREENDGHNESNSAEIRLKLNL
ncbi:MAG: hypothetical protein Q7S09_00005, partial [bacterium]|nr:hypothetical protein [bacterium]